MWLQRVAQSFVLVVLLGSKLPQIVHDFIPFNAEGYAEQNVSCRFARSRMIDFFEYQITYDFNVTVNATRLHKDDFRFTIGDDVNGYIRVAIEGTHEPTYKPFNGSVFATTLNTTISTISVPPLGVKGGFQLAKYDAIGRVIESEESNFSALIPAAEPVVNPLHAALAAVYMAAVLIGFFIEIIGPDSPDATGELYIFYKEKTSWQKIKKGTGGFLSWMVTVAVVLTIVVITACNFGVVPPLVFV